VQAGLGDFAAAERDLRAAAALDRDLPESRADHLTALGQVIVKQGRLDDAARVLDESQRLAPAAPKTHLWRGAVLASLGRHDEALAAFAEFERTGGEHSAIFHHHRGLCRQQTGDFAGAIDDWSRASELDPAAKHYHARGAVYLAAGSPAIALKDFERALALDPGHADAHFGRALALAFGGRHADAAAAAEKALTLVDASFDTAYRAATVFAVAAQRVVLSDEELKQQGPTAAQISVRYLERSAELLRMAMSHVPAERRAELWAQFIAEDPQFKPLLKEPEFRKVSRGVFEAAGVDDVSSASPAAATADASVTAKPAGDGQ
jgi:tetratricopeptide (TPR) repeat protein